MLVEVVIVAQCNMKDRPNLILKNLKIKETALDEGETYEEDGGFFTIRYGRIPELVHFYVPPEKRGGKLFRRLATKVRKTLRDRGHRVFITNARIEDDYLNKFLKSYLKSGPYAQAQGQNYYLTRV